MGDRIGGGLAIAAFFAIILALVAFPPAGIVVAIAVIWWMIQTDRKETKEFWERHNRQMQERETADQAEIDGEA